MSLIRTPSGWELPERKIHYIRNGEEFIQVMGDEGEQWWHDFCIKWPETEIVEFIDIEYTSEQLARLDEIQGAHGAYVDEVEAYVLEGTVPSGGLEKLFVAPPEPLPEPSEQDIINAELLLGQAQLIESNAAIEEAAALILLETIGGGL